MSTARLSRRRILAGLAALVLLTAAAVWLFRLVRDMATADAMEDNRQRVEYLRSWGWEVEPEPLETFQLLLPEDLPEDYQAYNRLQKEQNFDLEKHLGERITRYTYAVTNYPGRPEGVEVNLYLCRGQPVAGDVLSAGEDSFQAGLAYPEAPAGE